MTTGALQNRWADDEVPDEPSMSQLSFRRMLEKKACVATNKRVDSGDIVG